MTTKQFDKRKRSTKKCFTNKTVVDESTTIKKNEFVAVIAIFFNIFVIFHQKSRSYHKFVNKQTTTTWEDKRLTRMFQKCQK